LEEKKMTQCEECGKKLGIFEGYRHPTMGKKHLVCSPCFEQVEESVAKWREFVVNNSFNVNTTERKPQVSWKEKMPDFAQSMNIPQRVLAEILVYL
jgi:hypothetical protein